MRGNEFAGLIRIEAGAFSETTYAPVLASSAAYAALGDAALNIVPGKNATLWPA